MALARERSTTNMCMRLARDHIVKRAATCSAFRIRIRNCICSYIIEMSGTVRLIGSILMDCWSGSTYLWIGQGYKLQRLIVVIKFSISRKTAVRWGYSWQTLRDDKRAWHNALKTLRWNILLSYTHNTENSITNDNLRNTYFVHYTYASRLQQVAACQSFSPLLKAIFFFSRVLPMGRLRYHFESNHNTQES
jgi:hypothetical protein